MLNHHVRRIMKSALLGALVAAAPLPALSQDSNQQRKEPIELITSANNALNDFMRDPEMKWLQQNIGRAKAVMIAPEVAKAGFIFGGSGGRAVVLAKGKDGKWAGPAFYSMITASVGFQAGISVSQVVTLVMSDKGLNSLLSTSVKLGGDASIAAGPVGAGAKSDIVADFITFSRSKGVYGGLNLDGTTVKPNDDWNAAFYSKPGVLPPDILLMGKTQSREGVALLANVTKSAGGK